MAKRKGPTLTIVASCQECYFVHTGIRYAVQGDSGCDVYCTNPDVGPEWRYIGDATWDTPSWCPFSPPLTVDDARTAGRREAFEEAAQFADDSALLRKPTEIAAELRALATKERKL